MSDRHFAIHHYKRKIGFYPNIENPKLFTEKIQWLKLYDKNPLYTECADKYKVRAFVKRKIGEEYLIPLVFESRNVDKINLNTLPNYPVIIKTNHDSSGGVVIKNKKNVDYKKLHKLLTKRLNKNYYYLNREWEYKGIKPRIIVEKLMETTNENNILNDYKIFCFNGEPKYIQTIFDRETEIKENWYDLNWNPQEFRYFSTRSNIISKPKNLNVMIELSRKLSKDFKFVRVDLYEVDDKIYFGELTFRPYSGFMKWKPKGWDLKLGNELKINS